MPPPPQPPPPPPPTQHSRTNLGDLKSQIANRLGPERAQRYFSYLNRLLSQKLSKPEFNMLCLLTLGRENLPLHNQLIRSILKNACQAKIPPPVVHDKGTLKPVGAVAKKSPQIDESFNSFPAAIPPAPIWSNGDILPSSPRKFRSIIRDRKIKDPSPLGPNGRAEIAAHQFSVPPDEDNVQENGDLNSCDSKRPWQHQQGGPAEQPAKRPRTESEKPSPLDQDSVYSKGLAEVIFIDHREDLEHRDDLNLARGPLQAPLGIPFCPASVGGARRSLLLAAGGFSSSYDCGELYHSEVLKKRMEKIAGAQGLGGVTMDCANLLNNGLDAYLKQLIKSCAELVGARKGHEPIKHLVCKQQPHGKPINGVWLRDHMQGQSIGGRLESAHGLKNHSTVSLQDFRVAMELNPQQLGEDWPLLLEKICIRSCEE
ncbi:hypothetical protein COCNU_02G018710 [Cocos nucifera]|uniref:Transcriptional coactivator Hfi1/Transcriptional adapter 1 n=1 Tax=Cocos nucifera TaxID=13894 RepID=A0A8K0I1T4_COCNU|nr:hypothetical protein COCNU_02G018710 [Cocos nucifera]